MTKQEIWKIQPGSMATMTIDLSPPKPAVPARAEPAKGDKGKVQSFKPVTGDEKAGKRTNRRMVAVIDSGRRLRPGTARPEALPRRPEKQAEPRDCSVPGDPGTEIQPETLNLKL